MICYWRFCFGRLVGVGLALAGVAGCATRVARVPTAPAVTLGVGAFVGTPLSGPTTDPAPSDNSSPLWLVGVRWVALQGIVPPVVAAAGSSNKPGAAGADISGRADVAPSKPTGGAAAATGEDVNLGIGGSDGLLPIDARANLTVSPMATRAVLTNGLLTYRVGFGQDKLARDFQTGLGSGRFGKSLIVAERSSAALANTTVTFSLHEQPNATNDGPARGLTIAIQPLAAAATTRPATRPTTGPGVGNFAMAVSVTDSSAPGEPILTETAYLNNLTISDGEPMAVVAPAKWASSPWHGIAALITISQASFVDGPALGAELHTALVNATQPATATMGGGSPAIQSAMTALNEPATRRQGLLFLANSTSAAVANDVALVADDGVLADVAKHVAGPEGHPAPGDEKQLQWLLESTCMHLLAQRMEKSTLSPELQSVLTVHLGEVGRHSDMIESAVAASGSETDFGQQVIAQNLIELEDNSPASRVRAFDWLKSQGSAPAGYDPLGSASARRAALDRALRE